MTSFWNRPVWYVAVLRCVVGGVVGAALYYLLFAVLRIVSMILTLPGLDDKPPDQFALWMAFIGVALSIYCFIRVTIFSGKLSAIIAYRGQNKVPFVPKLILTFLTMWLTCVGIMSVLNDLFSETPDWEPYSVDLSVIGLFYFFFYFISLLVYHYVELAKEPPVEEP